jgi:tetratricopeptide (TPR) repeat protein
MVFLALLGGGVAWGQPAAATEEAPPVQLTPAVEQSLAQLREEWAQWAAAFLSGEEERSREVVQRILTRARELGFERLPDLSLAASVRALETAAQGDPERARRALEVARLLDPGRPETAFHRARVEWIGGHPLASMLAQLDGYRLLLGLSRERVAGASPGLGLWLLAGLLLTGGLFIAGLMAIAGPLLVEDMTTYFRSSLPAGLARTLTVLALLWPLLLPSAVPWLLLYWSVLLWGYSTHSERVVILALWLIVGVAPWWADRIERRTELALSPPVTAMKHLSQGRLYGGLLSDVGELSARLPDRPAAILLLADFHRDLGQLEEARRLYRQALEVEPGNPLALLGLGAFYFYNQDYGRAAEYYSEATKTAPESVVAWYNLSQAYSSSNHFQQAEQALSNAQRLDKKQVSGFVQETVRGQIVRVSSWESRLPEIVQPLREQLEAVRDPPPPPWGSLFAVSVLLGLALFLHWQRGRPGPAARRVPGRERWWLRALLPGLPSLGEGKGGKAFAALALPVFLIALAAIERVGYPLPAGAGGGGLLVITTVGLLLTFGARLFWELRRG